MEKQQRAFEKLKSFHQQKSFLERKNRESPGKRGDSELHLAARAGNLGHVVKILSDCDDHHAKNLSSKQNQDGETALYVAAEKGHFEVVREILKVLDMQSAAIKAKNSFDPLHIAAKQGHLDVMKVLLHSFPSLAMTTNSVNSTALDTAATQGHIEVVDLLLETDASLAKISRSNGKTVLHSAARTGRIEVVRSLLNKDPGIGLRTDKKGQTALHMAVKGHNIELVRELVGPDPAVINVEDAKGNTPLHIATKKSNLGILQALLSIEDIDVNAVNKAGETALGIADKFCCEETAAALRAAGGVVAGNNPPNAAKQLKETVSDIKHNVQMQLHHTRQTQMRVLKIKKRLQKLHLGGLNNAINSNTVVAVLIATVAFAAIFTVPGQYVATPTDGLTLGQAYIAADASFIVFLVSDSLALFISLAVVVVQTSLIVVEQSAKKLMVFVINKLMWLACLFTSAAFISLTYVVVGRRSWWMAWTALAIGGSIMLGTIGAMCYYIVVHRIEEKKGRRRLRAISRSRSRSLSMPALGSDSEFLNSEYKKMYAL